MDKCTNLVSTFEIQTFTFVVLKLLIFNVIDVGFMLYMAALHCTADKKCSLFRNQREINK